MRSGSALVLTDVRLNQCLRKAPSFITKLFQLGGVRNELSILMYTFLKKKERFHLFIGQFSRLTEAYSVIRE